jgi:hypothetical protein
MSKRLAALAVTVSALVLVPGAAAKDLKGVVVKVDPSQLAVARDNGDVELVRTALAAKGARRPAGADRRAARAGWRPRS